MVKRGFTLIEVMLTVAIVGIVFIAGAPLLNQANRLFIMNRTRVELQGEARSIM